MHTFRKYQKAWASRRWENPKGTKDSEAIMASKLSIAIYRAQREEGRREPPCAAVGGFPYYRVKRDADAEEL